MIESEVQNKAEKAPVEAFKNVFYESEYTRDQLDLMDFRTRKIAYQKYPHDTVSILAAKMIRDMFGVDVFYYSEGRRNIQHDVREMIVDGETKLLVSEEFLEESSKLTQMTDIVAAARKLSRAYIQVNGEGAMNGRDPEAGYVSVDGTLTEFKDK